MIYKFTFTDRFEKHYKKLTLQDKDQIKKKLNLEKNLILYKTKTQENKNTCAYSTP